MRGKLKDKAGDEVEIIDAVCDGRAAGNAAGVRIRMLDCCTTSGSKWRSKVVGYFSYPPEADLNEGKSYTD